MPATESRRGGAGERQALLFAGGDAPPAPASIPGLLPLGERALVVCADAGLVHCLDAGLIPHRLVGDFDSVDEMSLQRAEAAGAQRIRFPSAKNASDLALALEGLCEDGVDRVTVLGVSGGRTDHLLFNWALAVWREWPFSLRLVDASCDACVVTCERALVFRSEPDALVSLLALTRVRGVTTHGLHYALTDHAIAPGDTLGLSNVACGGEVRVAVSRGTLLVLRVR